ncbi:hypothetical protein KFL_001570120 [Klebsormidium nitens]|uniref:Uncharacterized protein n=1 Tax=Klebsormidium nitens TaxID=105231 RepID=A0A0U9HJY1_KLENI|nr:hypothetical protein KFL_001570120 [Klebsormidium nitens]|eukprot:GAQ83673.1 hypothetical protein KFL_001570120 [Klebsormidium nitens]
MQLPGSLRALCFCLGLNAPDEDLSEEGDTIVADEMQPSDAARGDVDGEMKPSEDTIAEEEDAEVKKEEDDLSLLDRAALQRRVEAIVERLSGSVHPGPRRRSYAEASTGVNETEKASERVEKEASSKEREKPFKERDDYYYVTANSGGDPYE